jgi:hypothetical protein
MSRPGKRASAREKKAPCGAAGVAGGGGAPRQAGALAPGRLLRPRCPTSRRSVSVGWLAAPNEQRPPDTEASCGEGTTVSVRRGYASVNLPRSVLRKRDWSFLILISRVSAACNVACGVLPAGLVQ